MNKKQKQVITIGVLLITATFIIWLLAGGDFFTKTQILVEQEVTELDQMLGVTPQKEYQDSFVFGLVPPGLVFSTEMLSVATISGLIFLLSGLFYFKNKSKT